MIFWVDAQLSPALATWIRDTFGIEARAVRELGLREAADHEIYLADRKAGAAVLTKDRDFLRLQQTFGPPPAIIWITCGNTSNARLREILLKAFSEAARLLERGEIFVEIRDAP